MHARCQEFERFVVENQLIGENGGKEYQQYLGIDFDIGKKESECGGYDEGEECAATGIEADGGDGECEGGDGEEG